MGQMSARPSNYGEAHGAEQALAYEEGEGGYSHYHGAQYYSNNDNDNGNNDYNHSSDYTGRNGNSNMSWRPRYRSSNLYEGYYEPAAAYDNYYYNNSNDNRDGNYRYSNYGNFPAKQRGAATHHRQNSSSSGNNSNSSNTRCCTCCGVNSMVLLLLIIVPALYITNFYLHSSSLLFLAQKSRLQQVRFMTRTATDSHVIRHCVHLQVVS